jgi:hypothetical protein
MITLPPSCADCLEIWGLQIPGALRACPGLCRGCITFTNVPYSSVITPVFHIIVITPEPHNNAMIALTFLFCAVIITQSHFVSSPLSPQLSMFMLVRCSHSCSSNTPVSHIMSSLQRRAINQNHNLELIGVSPLTLHSLMFWRKCKLLLAVGYCLTLQSWLLCVRTCSEQGNLRLVNTTRRSNSSRFWRHWPTG